MEPGVVLDRLVIGGIEVLQKGRGVWVLRSDH
jgi:hypothetical protein